MRRRKKPMKNKLLAAPYIVWMVLFTLIPLGIVFCISGAICASIISW